MQLTARRLNTGKSTSRRPLAPHGRASERNHNVSEMRFEENARQVEQHAAVIRQMLHNNEKAPVED